MSLDGLHRVVVAKTIFASCPTLVFDAIVADPSIRDTRLSSDFRLDTCGREPGHIVVPRDRQRPGFAQFDPHRVAIAVARPGRVGSAGPIGSGNPLAGSRHRSITPVAAGISARRDVRAVVVPQFPLDHDIGHPTECVYVFGEPVDRAAGGVPALDHCAVDLGTHQHGLALGDVRDNYVGVPLTGHPLRAVLGEFVPSVVPLRYQLGLVPGECLTHQFANHLMLPPSSLIVERVGLLMRLGRDHVIRLDLQLLLSKPPPHTPQVIDEGLGRAITKAADVLGAFGRHRRSGVLRRDGTDVAVQCGKTGRRIDHGGSHHAARPTMS